MVITLMYRSNCGTSRKDQVDSILIKKSLCLIGDLLDAFLSMIQYLVFHQQMVLKEEMSLKS